MQNVWARKAHSLTHSLTHSNAIEDLVHKDEIRQQKMHRRGVDQFIKRSRMKDERDIHNIHIDERSTEARRKARRGRWKRNESALLKKLTFNFSLCLMPNITLSFCTEILIFFLHL